MGKEMEAAVGELRKTQEALQKLMDGRAALQTQSHENEMVKAVRACSSSARRPAREACS